MKSFLHERLEQSYLSITKLDRKLFYNQLAKEFNFQEEDILATNNKRFDDHEYAIFYALYNLYKNHNKIFLIEDELTQSLRNTDVKVKMRDILPLFRTFIIYLNNSTFMINDTLNGIQKEVAIKYVFVELFKFHKFEDFLCLKFFIGYSIGDENDLDNWYNKGFNQIITPYMADFNIYYDNTNPLTVISNLDDKERKNVSKTIDDVANFIISFVLYCNLMQKEITYIKPHSGFHQISSIKNIKKKRRLEKMLQNETRHAVYHLGKGYRIKYESKGGGGTKLDHKILVRGHFRHQWYGSKVDEAGNKRFGEYQKVVWIEPFFKGTNFEDNGNRRTLYKVGDKK